MNRDIEVFFFVIALRLKDRNEVSRVVVNLRLIIIIKASFYFSFSRGDPDTRLHVPSLSFFATLSFFL